MQRCLPAMVSPDQGCGEHPHNRKGRADSEHALGRALRAAIGRYVRVRSEFELSNLL